MLLLEYANVFAILNIFTLSFFFFGLSEFRTEAQNKESQI